MKLDPNYDPLSLANIVRERKEAQAKKTVVPTIGASSQKTVLNGLHKPPAQQNLHDEFIDLILNAPNKNELEQNLSSSSSEFAKLNGTKTFFSPHKLCEEKKKESVGQPFSFVINNAAVGEVGVRGECRNGRWLVQLNVPIHLNVQQKNALALIIKSQLQKELGVELEMKID